MREPRYLRISVTGRCSLRCTYCGHTTEDGPDDGHREISPRELRLLVECAAGEGVRKVRLTGGEPLVRPDLERLVAAARAVQHIREVTMTTSGLGLSGRAGRLRQSGLDRVNISLDTLDPDTYSRITGRDRLSDALDGVLAASEVFSTVKLNTVVIGGENLDEMEELVRFAGRHGLWIRFIEQYSSGGSGGAADEPGAAEVERRLRSAFEELVEVQSDTLSVERTYRVPSAHDVRVGIIAARAGPSCSDCSKLRYSADGRLLPCLFARTGVPVRAALKDEDGEAVRRAIRNAMGRKTCIRSAGATPEPISRVGG